MENNMSKELAAAYLAVMSEVRKLAKDAKNPHKNYRYASIEAFLEGVGGVLAEHGVIVVANEVECEYIPIKNGADGQIRFVYEVTLIDKNGVAWPQKVRRTVFVLASMGPQCSGIAQSYAIKNALRALFLIATGEMDEDVDAHKGASINKFGKNGVVQPVVHEIPPPAGPAPMAKQLPSTTTKAVIGGYFRDIQAAPDAATVENIIQNLEDLDAGGETVLKERALEVARVALDVHLVQTPKDKAAVKQRLETIKDSVQSYNALSKVLDSKCQ